MTLSFSVRNQTLTKLFNQNNVKIVADSKNYLIVKFNFISSDWNDKVKFALFTSGGKTYKKILGSDTELEMNECYVPKEVMKAGKLEISVYCGDLITTNKVVLEIEPSGYTEKIENEDLTPSTTQQINTLLHRYTKMCNDILKECELIKEELKRGGKE